jgi:hypothetical protein
MWLLGVSRYDVRCLFQFDGRSAAWRLAAAVLVRCVPPLLSLLGFASGIYAGVNLDVARLIPAAVVFLAATATAGWTSRRATWQTIILKRLDSYAEINPNRYVPVLLEWDDVERATVALRQVKLFPGPWFRQPSHIDGAYELTARLNVSEPVVWPQTETYDDFLLLIAHTLAAAGLRGRAAAFDAFPDGMVARWDQVTSSRQTT